MRFLIAAALLACLLPVSLRAQSLGEPLTLDRALGEAIRLRPALEGSEHRVEAARARVDQARAPLKPRLEGQFSASEGLPGAPQVFIGGLAGSPFKRYVGGSVTLVQTLLDFGRARAAIRSRSSELKATQQAARADRQRVVLEVRQAYLQALQARKLAEVNRGLVSQRRQVVVQVKTFLENGLVSRVDLDLAEVSLRQAEQSVVQAEAQAATAMAALAAAIGRPVPTTTPLVEPGPVNSDPASLTPDQAAAAAVRHRPELLQAEAQESAARQQIDVAAAGKRPTVNGLASVGKVNPGPLIESNDRPYAVALVVTIPILTGGLVEAQVREARGNAAAARAGREELGNQIRQQAMAAVAAVAAAEQGIRLAEAQQVAAADALSLATQRYQAQLASMVEVSQTQMLQASAEFELVRARYELLLARAALDFALGRELPPVAPGAGTPDSK